MNLWDFTVAGFLDALKAWPYSMLLLYKSSSLRSLTFKCFLLNGLLFLGSIVLWEFGFLWVLKWLLSVLGIEDNSVVISVTTKFSTILYYLLWVWPVYGLSFLLNSIWYQQIADVTQKLHARNSQVQQRQQKRGSQSTHRQYGFVSVVADEIYRSLLFSIFLVLATVVYYVPFIGAPLSFILVCWLYSYYSFEYNWINQKWPLEQRLAYFEERWAYFAGFGFPCTMLTFWFPQLVGGGLFALIFPMVGS